MQHNAHPTTNQTPRRSRRDLLRGGAAAAGAIALSSGARAFPRPFPPPLSAPSQGSPRDTLVLIFLRGGLDALSLCVPTGDGDYYAQRPVTGVPQASTVDLDGFFSLNVAASPLLSHYQAGRLGFAHAIGLPHPTRSHFEAMRRVEEASVTGGPVGSGWVARHLHATPPASTSAGRALAIASVVPQSLETAPETLTIPSLPEFQFGGPASTQGARATRLFTMYGARPGIERDGGRTALSLLQSFGNLDFEGRTPDGGAVYPTGKFGKGLYEAATLIKGGTGLEAIEVDFGGWDDHSSTGPVTGEYAVRVGKLSAGLDAFLKDLGPDLERTTVLVQSEFGRRVDENGSGGSDHGRAGLAMVLGGSHVLGGRVHRQWPGLDHTSLDDGALAVTTDLRELFGEILVRRMGATPTSLAAALPGFTYQGGTGLLV